MSKYVNENQVRGHFSFLTITLTRIKSSTEGRTTCNENFASHQEFEINKKNLSSFCTIFDPVFNFKNQYLLVLLNVNDTYHNCSKVATHITKDNIKALI